MEALNDISDPLTKPGTNVALSTEDFRLAIVLIVLGSKLNEQCPVQWIDDHFNLESFLSYLESKKDGHNPPEPRPETDKYFNFESITLAQAHIYKAFQTNFAQLNAEYEVAVAKLQGSVEDIKALKMAVSYLIARACHQVFIEREFVARELDRLNRTESAKWDRVSQNGKTVQIGKISSPELRHNMLKRLQ
jgi:hypothetical protein